MEQLESIDHNHYWKQVGQYKVYLINGQKLREEYKYYDFLDYGTAFSFNIPKYEIWIERTLSDAEKEIALSEALIEIQEYQHGKKKEQIYLDVAKLNYQLRETQIKLHPSHYKKIYIKKYVSSRIPIDKDITVWIVNGETVRNREALKYHTKLNPYIEGGHGYVYPFIPKHEIWIDNTVGEKDFDRVLMHEYTELKLMRDKNMEYHAAHKLAEKAEEEFLKVNSDNK